MLQPARATGPEWVNGVAAANGECRATMRESRGNWRICQPGKERWNAGDLAWSHCLPSRHCLERSCLAFSLFPVVDQLSSLVLPAKKAIL